jgi:cellulose synthase/poly-beta-1,6-N-acetylglucosamine synthase-like glycosyltransferase
MKKRVSVVIPVKGSQRTIRETVRSLLEQSYGSEHLEIILVGDPGDPSFEPLAAEIAAEQVLAVGVAVDSPGRDSNAKRNVGLTRATGDVIALTDSDMILPRDWVETGVRLLEDGEHACVAGSMRSVHTGFWGRYTDTNPVAAKTPRMEHTYVVDEANFGRGRAKPPITANVFLTRELYTRVGGLDPAFVHSYEDYEWFWRIARADYTMLCTDELAADHFHRQGIKALLREYHRSGRGCAQFIHAHPSAGFAHKRLLQLGVVGAAAVALLAFAVLLGALALAAGAIATATVSLATAFRVRHVVALVFPLVTLMLGLSFSLGLTRGLVDRRRPVPRLVLADVPA